MTKEEIERAIEEFNKAELPIGTSGMASYEIDDMLSYDTIDTIRTCLQEKLDAPDYKAIAQEMYFALKLSETSFNDKTWAKQGAHQTIANAIAKYEALGVGK